MNIESCSRSLSGEKMRDAVRAALIRHRAWKWGLAAAATAVYCVMNNKRRPQNTSCFFSLHLNPHSLFFFSTIKWRHKINKYEAALSLERPFPSAHTFLLVLKTQNKIKKYLKKKGGGQFYRASSCLIVLKGVGGMDAGEGVIFMFFFPAAVSGSNRQHHFKRSLRSHQKATNFIIYASCAQIPPTQLHCPFFLNLLNLHSWASWSSLAFYFNRPKELTLLLPSFILIQLLLIAYIKPKLTLSFSSSSLKTKFCKLTIFNCVEILIRRTKEEVNCAFS